MSNDQWTNAFTGHLVIIPLVMRRLFLLAGLILAGCSAPQQSQQEPATSSAWPKDDLGREIKLSGAPQRVISLAPGVTEIIFALGEGRKIVARDQSADFPPEAKKLPVVADYNGPFFEKVVAQRARFADSARRNLRCGPR